MSIEKIYGLTPTQQGMYYQKWINKDSTEYVIQFEFQYKGLLDTEKMKQSLALLSVRHEVLRTSFVTTKSGRTWQTILHNREIEFIEKHADSEVDIKSYKKADLLRRFDLKDESLLRITVVHMRDDECILLWTMHHIIMDGWCVSLLLKDFLTYYEVLLSGTDYGLIKCEIEKEKNKVGSYQDYIKILDQKNKESSLKYWEQLLDGYSEAAVIMPLGAIEETSNEVERVVIEIDKEVSKKLQTLARREKITLNNIAEAAWGIVLQKYNQTEDVVFGTVVSGRNVPIKGVDGIVGLFINSIPRRIKTSKNNTIKEVLQLVHKQGIASSEHDYCSLVEVQKRNELGRHLFSTLFAFENFFVDEFARKRENVKHLDYNIVMSDYREQTNYGLSVTSYYHDSLCFNIMFDPRVYGRIDVELLLKRLEVVVVEMAENPDKNIGDIEIISDSECRQILFDFNDTASDYPRDKTIHQLFEEQVERTPDNVALIYEEERLTYRELNEKANALAHKLRKIGVKPDDFVGIIAERGIEMIAGIFGVIKSGGAYVPMDPAYPKDRIQFMLTDCKPKAVLVYGVEIETCIPVIDIGRPEVWEGATDNPEYVNQPENLIYCIYTSGTTGKPKGVMIENRSVVNFVTPSKINSFQQTFVNQCDYVYSINKVTFDITVQEYFLTLCNGMSIILSHDEMGIVSASELKNISDRIGLITMPTKIEFALKENIACTAVFSVIMIGAEKLNSELVHRIKLVSDALIINGYGPTETTCGVLYYRCEEVPGRIPIGRPISNTQIYVLGGDRLCGIGIPGELCISGEGVARGYLNRPELTAEKFVPNPFIAGERMYRTGDLARWLPDGNIEFLGRIDHQVKIHGFRIEPGEIEDRLMKHNLIREVIVVAKEDLQSNKYLCAYFTALDEISLGEVRQYLLCELPEYMIPAYIMQIEKMPLTSNGKIDRERLPEPQENIKTAKEYEAPRNEVEYLLVEVMEEILGVEKIGVRDNFLFLGGDSIKALQASARMQKHMYSLKIDDLFRYPVIKELSRFVEPITKNANQEIISGDIPLTPIQTWFFEKKFENMHHWNQSVMLYNADGFDRRSVEKSFQNIVRHHDALRMVFDTTEIAIRQFNRGLEGSFFSLDTYDYSRDLDYEVRITEAANRIQANINLNKGPLIKIAIFRTSNGEHLLIVIHHLIIDGISWRILLEDLISAYNETMAGKNIEFQNKSDSYKVWSESLIKYAAGEKIQLEQSYWEQIEKADIKPLPKDYDIGMEAVIEKKCIIVRLSQKETVDLLTGINHTYNTEIMDIILTALGLSVQQWTGENKILINLEGHGRESISDVDITRTIGWFTSSYPHIIDLSKYSDLAGQIKSIKEDIRRIPQKGIGYGILKYLTPKEKKNVQFSLEPEMCLNYLGQFGQDLTSNMYSPSAISQGDSVDKETKLSFAIEIVGIIKDDCMELMFNYSGKQYKEETINKLAYGLIHNMSVIIDHCIKKKEIELTPYDVGNTDLSFEDLGNIIEIAQNL